MRGLPRLCMVRGSQGATPRRGQSCLGVERSLSSTHMRALPRMRGGDRQFGLAQGIPGEPRSLGAKHNECLTGPKGKNWRNEYRDWIGEWLNRVPVWHSNYPPPGDSGGFEEEPEQPQQAFHAPHRSPTPLYMPMPAPQIQEEQVFPPHESVPPPSSFPESSAQQLSSYPLFMNTVAPFLSDHMDPHAFNTLYSMVDGVHRPGSVPHVDLNFNVSWSQEGDEAARYTRFRDTNQCNSNDNDMDEMRMRRRITWSRTRLVMTMRRRGVQLDHPHQRRLE
ncbi:hypothetical protein PIB30_079924 [Stylosanthes scabra]|uniref:Uncharacterized protein n=1 Tax=Stylosanthes scabra TaxID=79078 RepID=A0ABU6SRQ4_9FABA|nr:hypothetical protein [Stylosanthes scabra]